MGPFVIIGLFLIVGILLMLIAIFADDKSFEEIGFFTPIETIGILINALFRINNPKLNRTILFSLGLIWTIIMVYLLIVGIIEFNNL